MKQQQALGMIETRGLVGAIEASDAAVKAADVRLLGYEKVTGGLVMMAVTGEVAAVQAAIAAGSAAAERVGELIGQHVIPRPIAEIPLVFTNERDKEKRQEPPKPEGPDGNTPLALAVEIDADSTEEDVVSESTENAEIEKENLVDEPEVSETVAVTIDKTEEVEDLPTGIAEVNAENASEHSEIQMDLGSTEKSKDELASMTVGELRRLARKTPGIAIHGRQISRANKETLISEITSARKENA